MHKPGHTRNLLHQEKDGFCVQPQCPDGKHSQSKDQDASLKHNTYPLVILVSIGL